MEEIFPTVIDLNVGGKRMTTLLSTLMKDSNSMLAAMFSGRHVINKDKDGCFFIDCEGTLFKHILNYLRFGNLPPVEEALEVFDLATYFGIQSLVTALENYQSVQQRRQIAELKSTFDMEHYEELKLDIIKELNRANVDQKQSKILHIVSNPPKQVMSCVIYKHKVAYRHRVIEMENRHPVSKFIQRCLVYDLCELGFEKYTQIIPLHCNACCAILFLPKNLLKMYTDDAKKKFSDELNYYNHESL